MDGPFLVDTFTPLDEAARIARYLITEDPEQRFPFVARARIGYLLSQPALVLKGAPADAYIAVCMVQGANRLLWQFLASTFLDGAQRLPLDFLVYVDAAAWSRRRGAERGRSGFPIEQEALIYHELCHLRQLSTSEGEPRYHEDGREMLALQPHTYEFFDTEIRRYGPLTLQLEQVGTDYVAGAKTEKTRRRRGQLRIA